MAARWLRLFIALACGAAAFAALAAEQPRARVDREYRLIDPQPVATGERIEVIEFFWYGCPFCNQLQAPFESWIARKPDDVEVRRVPAIFRESWVAHARLYYTLDALGELERLHQAVYRTKHVERERLSSSSAISDWAVRHGLERERWLAAYESEAVQRKVAEALTHTRRYAVQGTPTLVVDGRYLTSTSMSESVPGVIPILEELIVLARQRRAGQ
jgi:protein dithiol oxidoreductase (disulfide-forming)